MPVLNSAFVFDGPVQRDGSRMVIETHQCANGVPDQRVIYLAPQGFDPSTLLADHAASITAQLADAEAAANLNADAPPVAVEEGIAVFLQAMRAAYKASDKGDTCRIAWWLLRRIAAGQITDAQCQTAFGRTATQWTSFKTNTLTPQSNAWAAVIAATGQ